VLWRRKAWGESDLDRAGDVEVMKANLDCNFENVDSLGAKSSDQNLKTVISIRRPKYVDGDKVDDALIGRCLPMERNL